MENRNSTRSPQLPLRLTQLAIGLVLYGASIGLMVRAGLGLDAWDVFHQGLAIRTGLSLGTIVIIISAAVLLLWIPLRQMPGFGTLANALAVGLVADLTLEIVHAPRGLAMRALILIAGIGLNGIATGLYIGAGLGPGPRDGLMTGWARRTGRSIRSVRTVIEIAVLIAGWVLGGSVGVGTVAYAISIGPLSQHFIARFSVPKLQPQTHVETEGAAP